MTKSVRKAKPAARAAGKKENAVIALSPAMRAKVDAWAALQKDHPDHAEAVQRLLLAGLKSEKSRRPLSETAAAKASELAGHTLDQLGDTTATADEREQRKRRLLKGPKEFR
jgi:hypothetical protein